MLDTYLKALDDAKFDLDAQKEAQKEYDTIVDLIKKSDPYFQSTKFDYYGYEYCANAVCLVNPDDYDCPFRCDLTPVKKVDISGIYPIRNAFIARPGWVILAVDYSQIELRIAANLSGEPAWIEAFLTGIDVHDATARAVFKTDKILKWMRKLAKTCNFGALYGGGPGVLARNAGLEIEEAKKIYQAWCDGVPTVLRWINNIQRQALIDGYTATFFGRRRQTDLDTPYAQKLKKDDPRKYKGIEAGEKRKAGNHAVQGLAADFMKLAMVKVDKNLREANLEDKALLLGTIHDELIFEVKQDHLLQAVNIIQPAMEVHNFGGKWKVPLICDVEASWSWGSVEHYEAFLLPDDKEVLIKVDKNDKEEDQQATVKKVLINKPYIDKDADKLLKIISQFPGEDYLQISYMGSTFNVQVGDVDNVIQILRDENLIL